LLGHLNNQGHCGRSKIAPTGSLLFKVTVHEVFEITAQLADHPAKVDPGAGFADKVTTVPRANCAVHPTPEVHSMDAGELVTVPDPSPTSYTPSVGI
jgi:hypothetical protein